MWTIAPRVRALLVCPQCRGELSDVQRGLLCPVDGLLFPVQDGVPHLIRECALKATARERDACVGSE